DINYSSDCNQSFKRFIQSLQLAEHQLSFAVPRCDYDALTGLNGLRDCGDSQVKLLSHHASGALPITTSASSTASTKPGTVSSVAHSSRNPPEPSFTVVNSCIAHESGRYCSASTLA